MARFKLAPLLIAGALLASALPAQANLLQNGSFEDGAFVGDTFDNMDLPVGNQTISHWQVFGDSIGWVQYAGGRNWGIAAQQGARSLDLTGYHNDNSYGGVLQSFSTVIGQTYQVDFQLGYGGHAWWDPAEADYHYAGPAQIGASAGNFSGKFITAAGVNPVTQWEHKLFRFTASQTSTTLSFQGVQQGDCCYIGLDNVSVAAVPEPETYAMLLAGLGVIVLAIGRMRT